MRIARRYRGPEDSGNGGYSAGVFAQLVDGDAEVTLRTPPPLDTPLRVDGLDVYDNDTLVAEVRPTTVDLTLPEPVSFDEAMRLERPPEPHHPFPHCFVCGPKGEGLRLRPSAVGDGRVVAPWHVREASRELVWAALDCPGAFAVDAAGSAVGNAAAGARPEDPAHGGGDVSRGATVLGRLAAHIEELPEPGEELVVVAWALPGGDERRSYAGTSLFRGKTPLAWARATWFSVGKSLR